MEITVMKPTTVKVEKIKARCGVRYWEDGTVNGVEDTEGDLIPLRQGDDWCPTIDVETGRIEGWPDDQTIDDIATDTVVAALNYFRDKVLKTHRWQSSGGASLGTFFIGQCLYQFANIYRSALRAELERIEQATTPMDELPEDEFDVIKGIEATIVTNDTVAEAMALLTTDRARQALFLQEHGFTQREIANKLGLRDAKSVENLLGHQLRQLRNRKRTS